MHWFLFIDLRTRYTTGERKKLNKTKNNSNWFYCTDVLPSMYSTYFISYIIYTFRIFGTQCRFYVDEIINFPPGSRYSRETFLKCLHYTVPDKTVSSIYWGENSSHDTIIHYWSIWIRNNVMVVMYRRWFATADWAHK